MFHTNLTPLDGSTFGEHAAPLALSIARRSGAALRQLNVQPTLACLKSPPTTPSSRAWARR